VLQAYLQGLYSLRVPQALTRVGSIVQMPLLSGQVRWWAGACNSEHVLVYDQHWLEYFACFTMTQLYTFVQLTEFVKLPAMHGNSTL
jgi:hypothetical protein